MDFREACKRKQYRKGKKPIDSEALRMICEQRCIAYAKLERRLAFKVNTIRNAVAGTSCGLMPDEIDKLAAFFGLPPSQLEPSRDCEFVI